MTDYLLAQSAELIVLLGKGFLCVCVSQSATSHNSDTFKLYLFILLMTSHEIIHMSEFVLFNNIIIL